MKKSLASWTGRKANQSLPIIAAFIVGGIVIISVQLFSVLAAAGQVNRSVVVLDFELHDLTLMPNLEEERERTSSIAPMLRKTLASQHDLEVVSIDASAQAAADQGAGYLYEHHDVAAELGRDVASDLIVVGRVHKASFLFVYFKAFVIDTRTSDAIADLTVEVKGTEKRLTEKGVESLAEQIAEAIGEY